MNNNFNILWNKDDKIALALSGGVDSIVLFNLLVTQYKDSYQQLVVFHINHGLREQSYEEEIFVEKLASDYGVDFYKKRLNMKTLVKESHISEEMLARKLRYESFSKLAKQLGINKILTAHHKNDRVENIVMRLISGRSIDYNLTIEDKTVINGLIIYRPLLNILKRQLIDYATINNLKYYEDETNFNTDYTRNNIRHNVIPLLEKIDVASFDNLINFADYYKNINSTLKTAVLESKDSYIVDKKQDEIVFSDKILNLSVEEIYFILKDEIKNLGVDSFKTRALMKICSDLKTKKGNKSYDLKENLKIVRQYSNIYVHKKQKRCYNNEIELKIDINGVNKSYSFNDYNIEFTANYKEAQIGFNEEDLPLTITTRRNGDSVKINNMTKKVSRIFIDKKIPKDIRDNLPIVRNCKGQVLGVLGIGVKFNTENTKFYIKMKGQNSGKFKERY